MAIHSASATTACLVTAYGAAPSWVSRPAAASDGHHRPLDLHEAIVPGPIRRPCLCSNFPRERRGRGGDATMGIRLGDQAPDFTAETTEGTIGFHEWKSGKWAVLFSHPA